MVNLIEKNQQRDKHTNSVTATWILSPAFGINAFACISDYARKATIRGAHEGFVAQSNARWFGGNYIEPSITGIGIVHRSSPGWPVAFVPVRYEYLKRNIDFKFAISLSHVASEANSTTILMVDVNFCNPCFCEKLPGRKIFKYFR